NLGRLTDYLFVFTNGSTDANWQGATKGFVGNVAVDGIQASERTSGGVPYAGTIYTNDTSLGAWNNIVTQNSGQASAATGETARISALETDLANAFTQINALSVTAGFDGVSSTSLNGLNTQDGVNKTYVINVTTGFQVSSKINITGDAGDVFILRWDSDKNLSNGYNGQVKFQSGGAIVPLGGLTVSNFINVAGDINASGGGSNPASPYPQGPRLDDGTGALINGGSNFSGGGFFTGYWLTTGDPTKNFETASLSNAIFAGGWYTTTTKFSMTSGTSGVHVCADTATQNPGSRTANFWSSSTGQTFWDGVSGNETQAGQANYARGDLLLSPYTTSAQPGKVLDPVSGTYQTGLLIGDLNHDGITNAGENTIFYTKSQVQTLLTSTSNTDKRYDVARDLAAAWLNSLAGNPIELENTAAKDMADYIADAVDWIKATSNASGNIFAAGSAVSAADSAWTSSNFLANTDSGINIQNVLDGYNHGSIAYATGNFYAGS
ncbi:MAG TPA: hypothetical protein V6D33_19430, partial [Cyanophyceae cyanobacterium]